MTDAINTNNRLKTLNQPTENRPKGPAQSGSQATGNATASSVVELSSDQVLKEMERLPEVDNSRIESIKSAIASGEYKPNAEVIAQKFSEIEKLLP